MFSIFSVRLHNPDAVSAARPRVENDFAVRRPPHAVPPVQIAGDGCKPGGAAGVAVRVLADEAPDLESALRDAVGDAEALPLDVRLQERDEQYWLYVARVPSAA